MTSWLERRILVYAHQGGAREGPSSTMFAMQQALAAGADALELDVHATSDGSLVVCHDATVDRTSDGSGLIATLTLAELRRLDNAYWWVPGEVAAPDRPDAEYVLRGRAPADAAFGIATLDEVLEAFPDVILNLDIKQTAPAVAPYEEALARTLRDHARTDGVMVASFNDAATAAFRTFAPEVATSAGTFGVAEFWRAVHAGEDPAPVPYVALQIPLRTAGVTICDAPLIEAAHRAGLAVHVWTIDDPAEMAALVDLGVDAIMSDFPSVAVSVLTAAGAPRMGS